MNKVEYLDLLKDYLLKAYSEEESLEILTDYEEYFLNGKLDGKTEQEIIIELGSPKKIVNELLGQENSKDRENSFFNKTKNKFDVWFENKLSHSNNNSIVGDFFDKINSKFIKQGSLIILLESLICFFFALLGLLIGSVIIVSLSAILGTSLLFLGFLSYNKNEYGQKNIIKIGSILNIFLMLIFVVILYVGRYRVSREIFILGFLLLFITVLFNIFSNLISSKGSLSLGIISFVFIIFMIIAVFWWIVFVAMTVVGVIVAIVLTPYTLNALAYLNMSYLWILFPIILAIGLFIAMSIIIRYYSKLIYKICLYYVNWFKVKTVYQKRYDSFEIKEDFDEKE